jgi:aspartyl-tRNA(Asn)/glutamyl-tRNA(Gln) amidotransferase subunit A
MKEQGAAVREVSLPHTPYAVPTYYVLAPAEASSNLARYDGVRYGPRFNGAADLRSLYRSTRGQGFGPEVRRRILVGTTCCRRMTTLLSAGAAVPLIAKFPQCLRSRRRRLFTPTAPTPAFKAGEKLADRSRVSLGHFHRDGEPRRTGDVRFPSAE